MSRPHDDARARFLSIVVLLALVAFIATVLALSWQTRFARPQGQARAARARVPRSVAAADPTSRKPNHGGIRP